MLHINITGTQSNKFIETLQIAGEQIGLNVDKQYVPIIVLQMFAQNILNGIKDIYNEIVFDVKVNEFENVFEYERDIKNDVIKFYNQSEDDDKIQDVWAMMLLL